MMSVLKKILLWNITVIAGVLLFYVTTDQPNFNEALLKSDDGLNQAKKSLLDNNADSSMRDIDTLIAQTNIDDLEKLKQVSMESEIVVNIGEFIDADSIGDYSNEDTTVRNIGEIIDADSIGDYSNEDTTVRNIGEFIDADSIGDYSNEKTVDIGPTVDVNDDS
jgi:hypothetical protein